LKDALRRAVARLAPVAGAGGTRVLLYHAVDEPDPLDTMSLRVTPEHFRRQMTLLRDGSYDVVPLRSVLTPSPSGRPRVAITFDDGYRSQAGAAGVLAELGLTATFFVTPRFIDGVKAPAAYWEHWSHLGWSELAALQAQGFEIGAHSMTHPDLRHCTDMELDGELAGAKDTLEQRLRAPVESCSYPYGRHDRRVRAAAARAGYALACTSRYGVNRDGGRCHSVRRTEIAGTDDLDVFRAKLDGKYDWLGYWQDIRPLS
jgi:peptidoglycan/xylan/chitin deacetylase (PgdA/CDA1 family)